VAADRHGVVSVPAIVANNRLAWVGSVPEATFVQHLLEVAGEALP
jgi:predicted DsbA family dithiol-disulfide isomerase